MKLTTIINENLSETKINIEYPTKDKSVDKIIEFVKGLELSIEGELDGSKYWIPITDFFYAESVDEKTFIYTEKETFRYFGTLNKLEEKTKGHSICRISKTCLVNVSKLKCVSSYSNHRLKAKLINGEILIVSRSYIGFLKTILKERV